MRVAVCDNEEIFLKQFKDTMKAVDKIQEIDCYSDISMLFPKLQTGLKYDIVFMDIDWNDGSHTGINYASMINGIYPDVQIIFVTAYNDLYSQDIFFEPVNLCGYLVKPVNIDNLNNLLVKAEKKIYEFKSKVLTVKSNGNVETIAIGRIIYAESKGHQVFIYKNDSVSSVYEKLDEIQNRLGERFIRIHKSFCVNMDYIHKIEGRMLILSDGNELPISRNLQRGVKEKYLAYLRSKMRE